MLDYVTVFQISRGTWSFPFALAGLVPLAIGLILILGKWRRNWRRPSWLLAGFLCVFGFMWAFLTQGPILVNAIDPFTAFQTGQYYVVAGAVEDFHPMPYEGHQDECFSVVSQRFCYSDYEITPAFHNAASHGGPIRPGIHVRVSYLGGAILKLEIPKNEVRSAAESAANTEFAERQYAERTDHDPILQRINISFLFTATCWVLWWNLRWRQAIRFWVKRPVKPVVVYLFRIFFGVSLIESVKELIEQLRRHPVTSENLGATLLTTLVMCFVVAGMTAFSVWYGNRRDRKPEDFH